MTTLSDLTKNNISITFVADRETIIKNDKFGVGECTIEAEYSAGDSHIRVSTCGFSGTTHGGDIASIEPSNHFDIFTYVSVKNLDGITDFFNPTEFDDITKKYKNKDLQPLFDVVNKMMDSLFNLSKNAKLLNKHPRVVKHDIVS